MSYGEVTRKKRTKAVDFIETPHFVYKGKDASYRRTAMRTGHIYNFFPKIPDSVVNLSDLEDLLNVVKRNPALFDVGLGFARISQKAYNNQADTIKRAVEMVKEAGFDKKIKTKAGDMLKEKMAKEKEADK